MQKDKQPGGLNQVFQPRFIYQQSQASRAYLQRGEGTPFPGPGPNGMRPSHPHPQQPPTPPTSGQIQQQPPPPTAMTYQIRGAPNFRGTSPAPRMQRGPPQQGAPQFMHQPVAPLPAMMQVPVYLPQQYIPPMVYQPQFFSQHVPPHGPPYYRQSIRPAMGHVPNAQHSAPQHQINTVSQPPSQSGQEKKKRRVNAIAIVDPNSGLDVTDEILNEENVESRSGESSARHTPQGEVAVAEFTRKITSVASDDGQQPPSRGSNYSESENPSEPDALAIAPSSGISSPMLEGGSRELSVVGVDETPLQPVENNIGYPEMPMQGWPQPISVAPEPFIPVIMMPDAAPREYVNSHMSGWPPDQPPAVCPPMGPVTVVPASAPPPPPQVVPVNKSATPVVSALTQGPPVDLGQFPALGPQRHGGGHQSPARTKRKTQKLEQELPVETRPPPVERTISPVQAPAPVVPDHVAPPPPVLEEPRVMKAPSPVQIPEPAPPAKTIPAPQSSPPQASAPVSQESAPAPDVAVPPVIKPAAALPSKPEPAAPVAARVPSPAPVKSSQVTEPAPTSQDAKNQRNKSKKHRPEQHQQAARQATPPPSAPAPVVKPQVEAEPPAVTVVPPVVEPETVEPPPAAPATKQVDPEPEPPAMQDPKQEPYEDTLVAAMNAENTKLSAVQTNANDVSDAALENNNVPNNNKNNVTVIVEPSKDATPVIEYSKPVLKHVYQDDQWSPVNQSGKRKYERDFIMKLKNDPQSQKRPDNLPIVEALKDVRISGQSRDQGMRSSLIQNRHNVGDLMPSFGGKSSSMRSGTLMKRPSQMSNKPNKSNKNTPIQVSLSLNEEVKLRECATPWKPARNEVSSTTTEEERKTESLNKKVRGVLNKLTPEKFDTLVNQVKKLPIDTVERLRGVINLVFEKAVDEPGFSVAYAEMCKVLEQMSVKDDEKPPNPDGSIPQANFRALLLYRCQLEFEKDSGTELNSEARIKEIEDETDPEKKKELKLIWEEDQRKVRVKAVGNVRFVGELFKKSMITPNIMNICIDQLLRLNTEESLECLCKLLTTIGRLLEETVNARRTQVRQTATKLAREGRPTKSPDDAAKEIRGTEDCFRHLHELVKSKNKGLSNRVRFMIQDLIDLKNHNWIPRRDDAKPKTMEQVAKDAEREQIESNMALNASMHDKRGGGRQDSRHNMGGGKQGGSDNMNSSGWTAVNSNRNVKLNVETDKFKAIKELEMQPELQFGARKDYQWSHLQYSGLSMTQNKYAILLDSSDKPSSRSSSLKGTPSSDSRLASDKSRGLSPYQSSTQEDSRNNARNSQLGARPGSRGNSREPSSVSPVPQNPSNAGPLPLSTDDNARITQNLLEEFLNVLDFEDASKNLSERFATEADKDLLVCNMMVICVDKNTQARRGAGRLLAHFLLTDGITRHNFLTGLGSFLEQVEDIVPDAPMLWEYLAEETVDVVKDGLGIAPLLDALKGAPFIASLGPEGARKTVATLLRIMHTERPNASVIQTATPLVKEFVGQQDYDSFIQKHSLQFLETPASEPVAFDSGRTADELIRLLKRNVSNDQIFQWITCNVGAAATEPAFIFALMTAVLEVSVIRGESMKLDAKVFTSRVKLLVRYIENEETRELHALYALQAKVNQWMHPRGVLSEVCTLLSDNGIISNEAFNTWKKTDDIQYAEGKGVCVTSLTSFFVNLNEGEDDEGS